MDINYKRDSVGRVDTLITWEHMKAEDEGIPLESDNIDLMSVAFEGKFRGAEAILRGTIGEEWHYITDDTGRFVSARDAKMIGLSSRYLKISPIILNGTDETDINVIIFGKRLR